MTRNCTFSRTNTNRLMSLHTAGKFEGSTVMRGFLQKACRAIKTCLLTSGRPTKFLAQGQCGVWRSAETAELRVRRRRARLVSETAEDVADDDPKHVPLASRCRHLFRHERPEASSQYDARQINDTVENLRYDCNEGSADQEAHETARSAVHAGGDHVCV